jgi:hypothetical protein
MLMWYVSGMPATVTGPTGPTLVIAIGGIGGSTLTETSRESGMSTPKEVSSA